MLRRQRYKAQRVSGEETFFVKTAVYHIPTNFLREIGGTFLFAKLYFRNVSENRVSSNHVKFDVFFTFIFTLQILRDA